MSEFEKWVMVKRKSVDGIWDVLVVGGDIVGRELTQEEAEKMVREHNALPKLVETLEMIKDHDQIDNLMPDEFTAVALANKYKITYVSIYQVKHWLYINSMQKLRLALAAAKGEEG